MQVLRSLLLLNGSSPGGFGPLSFFCEVDMGSVLYKDGETVVVEYEALQRHLDAGYTTEPDGKEKPVQSEPEAPAEAPRLDIADMRSLAEEMGIEDAGTMHHKTLKKALQDAGAEV